MAQPRILILRAPGTNCDVETAFAFERAGGKAERLHVNRVLESPAALKEFQVLCLPGGFSYGDDVAAGRILGNQIRRRLAGALAEFKAAGKLILGICNGFQILIKSGILLADMPDGAPPATLTWNRSGRYVDLWTRLKASSKKSVFLSGVDSMYLPIAHAEGQFITRDAATLAALQKAGQLALVYEGTPGADGLIPYPDNPNGSQANVAAVCDETGRVLGMMPHPERHIDFTQHPRWTREIRNGNDAPAGCGLRVFQNAVGYFK